MTEYDLFTQEIDISRLPVQKRDFVLSFAQGNTIKQAAGDAGVSYKTGWRYAHEPEVMAVLNGIYQARLGALVKRLAALAEKALYKLEEVLDDESTPAYVKVDASNVILTKFISVTDAISFERRLRKLEETAYGDDE